jgi:hypothetical protein
VTVSDGTFSIPTTFKLTANPNIGVVLADDFTYPDGSVTTNSGFYWNTHSAQTGATGQTQVASEKLFLTSAQSEDIHAFLTNYPYDGLSGNVFYARYVVNFSALPTASGVGEYFAHFKDFSGGQFRARIFATTNGAASGKFRLAISNGGFITTVFPEDLSLNTDYVVISRYNTATASESKLWVNPTSEASTSVTATDLSSVATIYSYALRQNTGIGSLSMDSIKIASTFGDVYLASTPNPIPLNITYNSGIVTLSWSNPAFLLDAAPIVSGVYTNIPGATSPYNYPVSGGQLYFRLRYPLP